MKLQVTESQLKLIEQQQLNELKWLANVQSHIVKMDVPLTPSLVNYIWGKQRVTTFHVSDVHGIDHIASMVGTRKSLSTFKFMEKTMLSKMRGVQTEGGIIYQIIGDLQFDAPSDIMSTPDEIGRRWINIFSFPDNFRNRLEHEYEVHEKFRHMNEPSGPSKDLIEYYRLIDRLVKEYAKEIREHFTDIKKNRGGRESSWNETVVNNIQVIDILWRQDIIAFLDTWETKEQRIKVLEKIGTKLNSIATGTVYLADNGGTFGFRNINPVKWVEQRGGLTNFKKYVSKFHKDREPKTIQINEDKPNPNNPPFIKNVNGCILVTPDKPIDNTACVIFGNGRRESLDFLLKQLPENLQYKKIILLVPPRTSMDTVRQILGKTQIKSVIGFYGGGLDVWPLCGEYEFVGLIDPLINKDSHKYQVNDKRVHMMYDPNNWVLYEKKDEMIKLQKEIANVMLGNAVIVKTGTSQMPALFFNKFQNYL
jgi:hypothetical protein